MYMQKIKKVHTIQKESGGTKEKNLSEMNKNTVSYYIHFISFAFLYYFIFFLLALWKENILIITE